MAKTGRASRSVFIMGIQLAVLLMSSPNTMADSALGSCAAPSARFRAASLPSTAFSAADCGFDSTNPSADYDPSLGLLTIEVVVHIIMDDTCTQGVVSDATVQTQMDILNEDFLAIAGSPGANGTDTQIRFVLADEDPDGNPTTGITRDCNTTWYNDGGDYWQTLAWDPNRYLNIYVNTAAGSGGYVPFLPAASNADIGASSDRVVINQLGFGPGGPIASRDQGRLTTHEVGHYLGLFHPYFDGCGIATAPDCYTTGDRLCDTAPDDVSHSGCPVGQTACGGTVIPATNYMELTDDSCKDRFTLEQARRMRCTIEFYRPGLIHSAQCGDGTCELDETSCNCAADCGTPPAIETACGDGIDNDCDGDIDCADVDCADEVACTNPCSVEIDFDDGSAAGWANSGSSTCSTGAFVVATPTQQSDAGVTTQVAGDHTSGSGNAFFTATNTALGTNDVDGGVCIAESPVYAISTDSDVSIWYFHGQRDGADDTGDFFRLEISTDGGSTYSSLVAIDDVANDAVWTEATATVLAGDDVRLRVQAADGTAAGDIVEAGIDDLAICASAPQPPCTVDADCDNGIFCDGAETCSSGVCQAGTPVACDDGIACTVDTCDELADACAATPDDSACDNGLFCDGTETCSASLGCQSGSDPCSGGACDEATDVCAAGDLVVWMSFRNNVAIPGVGTVADEDVVSYDAGTGTWALVFDGSDVGLGTLEISGLAVLEPSGDLLLSFTAPGTVGGLAVDDSDIVRFTSTSLGATTAGTFSLYFDGSDVGLTANSEDVDAIALAADGRLIVSSVGGFSGTGASGTDEDLFLFTGTLGATTSGSFAQTFDGSDVGLNTTSAEDVDAAAFRSTGELLFSTLGDFAVTGASGADEDVAEFAGTFGSSTSGTFVLRLDLDSLGIDPSEDIGSLHVTSP